MLSYLIPFIGLCVGILAAHDPLLNALDRLIDRVANPKD